MSGYEVANPILNSPYDPPAGHWRIVEGETPQKSPGAGRPGIITVLPDRPRKAVSVPPSN